MASEQIILVVDDNATVRSEALRALRGAGYKALEAATLAQARRMLAGKVAAVLIADELPDGSVVELVAKLAMPSLVLASTANSSGAAEAMKAGACGSLNRKRPTDGLVPAVRRAIAETTAVKAPKRASSPNARPVAEPVRVTAEPATLPDSPDDAAARVLLRALEKELAFLKGAGHYRVLGVRPDATADALQAAFERFKSKWHPSHMSDEATPVMRQLAGEIFALGARALAVLGDAEQREKYQPPPTLIPKSAQKRAPQRVQQKPEPLPVAEPADLFSVADLPPLPADDDPDVHDAREKLRQGDAAGAKGALKKALTLRPGSKPASALTHVAAALEKPDDESADRELEQALADDPNCVEALAVKEGLAQKRAAVLNRISSDRVSRTTVSEALVLVFSNSPLRDIVGTDALRTAVGACYIEMVKEPGVLDLAPLWQILAAQPGFSTELALPPICRLKLLERDIGAELRMPPALGPISLGEAHKHAAECKLADDALLRALSGANSPAHAAAPREAGSAGAVVTATSAVAERKKRGFAKLLLFGAIGVFAVSLLYTFGGSAITTLSPSEISTEIPAKEARKSGECIALLVPDHSWLSVSEEARKKQLEDALDHARSKGGTSVVIMDPETLILAQATADNGEVTVSFFAK